MHAKQRPLLQKHRTTEVRLILGLISGRDLPDLKSTRPVSTGRLRFCMEVNDV